MRLISVVVPIYFEEEIIDELHARLSLALSKLSDYESEIIYVNDGSTDDSLPRLIRLAETHGNVTVIDLSRNFGHQIAITAGIDAARGDAVVIIDGDLQDPPEVIAEMVDKWEQGYAVVYGQRRSRSGESHLKRYTAKLFYRLINRLSEVDLPLDTGDFRLMDRCVIEALSGMREETRYLRGMVAWIGFRQCAVLYDRDARFAGETKYTFAKMLGLALSGVTSFSMRPLLLASNFGVFVTVASFLYLLWIIGNIAIGGSTTTPGWASLSVIILFLGGVQLIAIGVLGEYLGRVFMETKRRPLYIVANRFGIDGDASRRPEPDAD